MSEETKTAEAIESPKDNVTPIRPLQLPATIEGDLIHFDFAPKGIDEVLRYNEMGDVRSQHGRMLVNRIREQLYGIRAEVHGFILEYDVNEQNRPF